MRIPQPQSIAPPPGRFKRWIKSDMLILRWVFLALYVLIAGGLILKWFEEWSEAFFLIILVAMLLSQGLLILGTGTIRLCHPHRRRRLVLPVVGAATMMSVLVGGLMGSLTELLYLDKHIPGAGGPWGPWIFFGVLG